jgi:hypothetical protein
MSRVRKRSLEEKKEQAKKARQKPAVLGPDIDISRYFVPEETAIGLKNLSPQDRKAALETGVDISEKRRSGTFFQVDSSVVCARSQDKGLEVLSTTKAREIYPWLAEYMWEAVPADSDKYTAEAALRPTHGYFIRAKKGCRSTFPLQACLFIGQEGVAQQVHNIIIAEEAAELHIITGCTTSHQVKSALHIGVSEFYVHPKAKITFTMIHNWAPEVEVRPRTGIIIEEGGVFISNYICLRPVKNLQLYPTAYLKGEGARVRFQTVLYGQKSSFIDAGSRAVLQAKETRAEILSRVIGTENSQIIARGELIGEAPEVKGHLECQGLILSPQAKIQAIPSLQAKSEDVELSHEAAVGKIAEEEIVYLMSRGLSEEEATSLIVRGFLNVEIEGLPPALETETKKLLEMDLEKIL